MSYELVEGDCAKVMEKMEDDSVDSIVTDPPYGLSFMAKRWDYDVPSTETWKEAFRVLKPGGHLLAFSGSRTYHRMVVNIEDAGFEIRDQIMWLYGSGFPKSLNVSRAIDKAAGAEREVIGQNKNARETRSDKYNTGRGFGVNPHLTAPASPEAAYWGGWGTALKPAHEPIVVARKPLKGTVAENVLEHGTGGINIDGCRIGTDDEPRLGNTDMSDCEQIAFGKGWQKSGTTPPEGRWPANVILDEEAGAMLDEQTGCLKSGKPTVVKLGMNSGAAFGAESRKPGTPLVGYGDQGGASRFFYCPKANQAERNKGCEKLPLKMNLNATYGMQSDEGLEWNGRNPENRTREQRNNHPTVKPVDLMKYLCRLVTPPGGVVLDPFMGSGTTGIAACVEGFDFIGIEMDADYIEIARHRIETWVEEKEEQVREERAQKSIFDW